MKLIRLDIDDYHFSRSELLDIYSSIPKPFMIRRSAFKLGFHIKFSCPIFDCKENNCYCCHYYLLFDDKRRLSLNFLRKKGKLSHNVLWDIKSGRKAEEWKEINTFKDMQDYLYKFK